MEVVFELRRGGDFCSRKGTDCVYLREWGSAALALTTVGGKGICSKNFWGKFFVWGV
jgi:hypothetical protein